MNTPTALGLNAPTEPKRILFVDDDENVLAGLRRALSRQRTGCELLFASSGAAALELLRVRRVDAIFSDMRMPEMDGASLLALARTEAPGAARVVLSGQTDEQAALISAGLAHRFLSKPIGADALAGVIRDLVAAQGHVEDAAMRSELGRLECLPSPLATCRRLLAALSSDEGPRDVASAIACDIGISAKVLQLASSSFFGLITGLDSARAAFERVGTQNLRTLIEIGTLGVAASAPVAIVASALAAHARRMSRLVGYLQGSPPSPELQLACQLHDVGVLAATVLYGAAPGSSDAQLAETARIGQYLLELWGLPSRICEMIEFARRAAPMPVATFASPGGAYQVLAVADALDAELSAVPGHGNLAAMIDHPELSRWKLAASRLLEEEP